MLLQIAAPIPRVPPVTSATRPLSFSPPGTWVPSRVFSAVAIASTSPRGFRPLLQPLIDVRPDLLACLRAGHQPDVPAGPVQRGDVVAADQPKQRLRALRRRDVVGTGGDDQHTLINAREIDPLTAEPHPPTDEPVLLVHPGDPVSVRGG